MRYCVDAGSMFWSTCFIASSIFMHGVMVSRALLRKPKAALPHPVAPLVAVPEVVKVWEKAVRYVTGLREVDYVLDADEFGFVNVEVLSASTFKISYSKGSSKGHVTIDKAEFYQRAKRYHMPAVTSSRPSPPPRFKQ